MADAKTNSYDVTLLPSASNAAKATYWRGGRQFAVHETQTLELTKEELEVYKNDGRFKIEDTTDSKEQEPTDEAGNGEENSSDVSTPTTEENPTTEVTDTPDTTVNQEEEVSGEDEGAKSQEPVEEETTTEEQSEEGDLTESQLLKLNRDKVNEYAVSKGLENPEQYETKKEVAEALNATK